MWWRRWKKAPAARCRCWRWPTRCGARTATSWTTLPRDNLYRAQTPQGFRFADILAAHRAHAARDVTDDVEIAALAGIKVEAVAGEETNLKVTTEKDFVLAETLAAAAKPSPPWAMTRTASAEGDHVWLCGVKIAARSRADRPFRCRCRTACPDRRHSGLHRRRRYRPAFPARR